MVSILYFIFSRIVANALNAFVYFLMTYGSKLKKSNCFIVALSFERKIIRWAVNINNFHKNILENSFFISVISTFKVLLYRLTLCQFLSSLYLSYKNKQCTLIKSGLILISESGWKLDCIAFDVPLPTTPLNFVMLYKCYTTQTVWHKIPLIPVTWESIRIQTFCVLPAIQRKIVCIISVCCFVFFVVSYRESTIQLKDNQQSLCSSLNKK